MGNPKEVWLTGDEYIGAGLDLKKASDAKGVGVGGANAQGKRHESKSDKEHKENRKKRLKEIYQYNASTKAQREKQKK
jgi:hypothetical protein